MSERLGANRCKPHERFRLRFQQLLGEYSIRRSSVAEGFGLAWERALEEVALPAREQGPVYRELLAWAKVIHTRQAPRTRFDNGR
jgi:hypothetical protein